MYKANVLLDFSSAVCLGIIWAPATVLGNIIIRLNFVIIFIYVHIFPTCFDRKDNIVGDLSATTNVNPAKVLQYNYYKINTFVCDKM